MKRSDIFTTPDDYLNAIRKAQALLTAENGQLVKLELLNKEEANRQWAALYDLQIFMQLAKRSGVGVPELTEWLGDAAAIRRGFAAVESKQQSLFNK